MKINKRRWRLIGISAVHAAFVLVMLYIVSNIPYELGGESSVMRWMDVAGRIVKAPSPNLPDSVLAINVAYDRQLVDVYDELGMPMGRTDITDRGKLLRLLNVADSVGTYKYIMLDVGFDRELVSEYDSALYALIARMPRIVVPRHNDMDLTPEIEGKAAVADYRTTMSGDDFSKFPLHDRGYESMPLRMWCEYTGSTYHHGLFATANGHLCRSSLFLTLPIRFNGAMYDADGNKTMYNLGEDVLDPSATDLLPTLIADKYIFVGDFVDQDMHRTYAGMMPGTIINFNAFVEMMAGKHYVSWLSVVILFVLFFMASMTVFARRQLWDFVPAYRRMRPGILKFVISWVGLSALFMIVFALFFILRGEVYDILFISSYFALLTTGIEYYDNKKTKIIAYANKLLRLKSKDSKLVADKN